MLLGQDLAERQQLIGRELRGAGSLPLVGPVVPPSVHAGARRRVMVRPVARRRYRAVPCRVDVHPTWLNRACAICVATVRCQISVYSPQLVAVERRRHPIGCPQADVGRIASCASCALRDRVLNRRGSDRAYSPPNSVRTSSAISRRAASAMVSESVT